MMKFLFYVFFLIPLFYLNSMMYFQFCLMVLCLMFLFVNCNSFFCSLSYFLGVDYFSYGLVFMSLMICSLMCISMISSVYLVMYLYVNFFMLLCLMIIFLTTNLLYMYISFEFVLFPLMMLILGWGYQPERLVAGLYLFFYTLIASFPFFLVILMVFFSLGSFFFDYLVFSGSWSCNCLFIMMAFLVSMPMFMFHFWLPKAHVQAPVSGSMILAGLMLKIGGYGLIRVMYIYEFSYFYNSYIWYSISLLGSIYVSFLCLMQGDMKMLVAYSSVAHMGLCILGLLGMTSAGVMGSYLLMLGHGFCSSGLFYMVNMYYVRTFSRSFFVNKGILLYLPSSSLFWFLFCCFNMSCPPSVNFISELMILMSMLYYWLGSLIYFVFISFFCACFSYYLYSSLHNGLYMNMYSFSSMLVVEIFCVILHLIPLFMLSLLLVFLFGL